jgi:hypothetical protein
VTVDDFRVKLEVLKQAWVEVQDCEAFELDDPLLDDVWDAYIVARNDTENAITALVSELADFHALVQIEQVRVNGVE